MNVRKAVVGTATAGLLAGTGAATLLVGTGWSPAGASTPTATATPAPSAPACDALHDDGGWPLVADGRPAGLDAGDAAGDYIWHDAAGWHLRVTHQNDTHQVWSGVLTTSGTFSDVTAVKLEKNDSLRVGPDKHTIVFRFNNYGGTDGIDFRTHCAEGIHFDLRADGATVNPTEVIIGHGDHNPAQVPFTIQRRSRAAV